jgi:hypothetical protein
MSNQVYRNDRPAVPNVYISDIIQPSPGGGAVVKSLTITDAPALNVGDERALVRDSGTGAVELGAGVIASRVILSDVPPLDVGVQRALARDSVSGTVVTLDGLLATSLTLSAVPTTNNTNQPFLVRNSATGVVEQRDASTVPHTDSTERHASVDQLSGDAADFVVLFDVQDTGDPGLSYNAGTGLFTVVTGGLYVISYSIAWEANAVGARWGWISFGSAARYASNVAPTVAGLISSRSGTISVILTATETFNIHAFQDSGIPLQVQGLATDGVNFTSMSAQRVSPAAVA